MRETARYVATRRASKEVRALRPERGAKGCQIWAGRKGFAKIEGTARAGDDECVRWDDLDLRSATPSLAIYRIWHSWRTQSLQSESGRPTSDRPPTPPMKAEEERREEELDPLRTIGHLDPSRWALAWVESRVQVGPGGEESDDLQSIRHSSQIAIDDRDRKSDLSSTVSVGYSNTLKAFRTQHYYIQESAKRPRLGCVNASGKLRQKW